MTSINCVICGTAFRAKRASARYCSPACRKRAFAERHEGAQDARNAKDDQSPILSVPCAPEPAGTPSVIDLGRLVGDTIADRRWRIVVEDGYRLECQALVPGGWKTVATEQDLATIRRQAAWMELRIDMDFTTADGVRAAA